MESAARANARDPHDVGSVAVVPRAPVGNRLDARAGDLVLRGSAGTSLVFAATADAPGHPAVRGAIVDVGAPETGAVHVDPLVWWRAAWGQADALHVFVADEVVGASCPHGGAGVRATGRIDGVALETLACAGRDGRYELVTTATAGLPPGAALCDEINVGSAAVGVERRGERWSSAAQTRYVTIAERGLSLALEAARPMDVRRDEGAGHDELQRALLRVCYAPGPTATRWVHLVAGDVFAALARLPTATQRFTLRGAAREFDLRDRSGEIILQGELPPSGARVLHLPPALGAELLFRDDRGVPASGPVPLSTTDVIAPEIARTTLRLQYTDAAHQSLAVHVLFRGLGSTPDPTPDVRGRGYSAGRSVYLLDGTGEVALAPGRYALTATHGPRYSLDVRELTLPARLELEVRGELREVVDTAAWTSGDFHLHAAPSPDSRVSLRERVGALYCEGVDFAVATDHNRVTDYAPVIEQLGIEGALGTVPGDEVTTFAPSWGHFIAYPLHTGGARSASVVPFYGTTPSRIFADARARGAQVLQVNHGRMHPLMGYFDFTHLDPATGAADATFADDFNAVEVFNGWYIERPDEVRRGVRDLVGLVRRGLRPAATGNSDSHRLLFEEAGYPRTYVRTPREPAATRVERVIDAMLHGRTTISAGPFVEITVGDAGPGDTVRPDARGRLRVHVRVQAPEWVPVERVEVWVDDAVARSIAVTTPASERVRFDADVELAIAHDSVVLAWADATTPLPDVLPVSHAMGIGLTGPVYVDADGDGHIRLPPAALVHP